MSARVWQTHLPANAKIKCQKVYIFLFEGGKRGRERYLD